MEKEKESKKLDDSQEADLIFTACAQFALDYEADLEERRKAIDDLHFVDGDQWRDDDLAARAGRPILTINKLCEKIDQGQGEQRKNRPQIKVRADDDQADADTAEILEGLIRNIEMVSEAEEAYDHAFEHALMCGYGAWRVDIAWVDDTSFDRELLINRVDNPFSVIWDASAKRYDRSDARRCFLYDRLPIDEFKRQFGEDAVPISAEVAQNEDMQHWFDGETVQIAEYFYKKEEPPKTLYLVKYTDPESGLDITTATFEKPDNHPNIEIVDSRTVKQDCIWWLKMSGAKILDGPVKLSGRYIPIVPVWGKEINVAGKRKKRGLIRHAKDPQRAYNFARCSEIEILSLSPKAPYMVTTNQIEGLEPHWRLSFKENLPYLKVKPDPTAPGWPRRESPPQLSAGHIQAHMTANDELKSTTGMYDASLGARSNETSGVAIRERKIEGDTAVFPYIDNLARSLRHTGRILIDLIPSIYNTPMMIRVLGEDMVESHVKVNQYITGKNGQYEKNDEGKPKFHDLTVGRYSVDVSIGPSYTTQRQEAAASMLEFIKAIPPAGVVTMDLVAGALDWPGRDAFVERLKKALPPGVLDPEEAEESGQRPMAAPPPGPPPPPPDPTAAVKLEIEQVKLEQEKVELAQKRAQLQRDLMQIRAPGIQATI